MTLGWQEIIAIGIVAIAALVMLRRALPRRDGAGGCNSCSGTTRDSSSAPTIKKLHEIKIDRGPPSDGDG